MTWPRHSRRICAHCNTKPCPKTENIYCSVKCYRAGTKKHRGLCGVCGVKPVAKQSRRGTCGRICGGILRWRTHEPVERQRISQMWKLGREAFLKRLAAQLKDDADALAVAKTPEAIAKALAKVYRKGYRNGSSAAYYRYRPFMKVRA